jgi:hypothetical protein
MNAELAKLGADPQHNDEDFDKSSTYSLFNQSLSNFNPQKYQRGLDFSSSGGNDSDAYLDRLLERERAKYREADRAFLENNEALQALKEMQRE